MLNQQFVNQFQIKFTLIGMVTIIGFMKEHPCVMRYNIIVKNGNYKKPNFIKYDNKKFSLLTIKTN